MVGMNDQRQSDCILRTVKQFNGRMKDLIRSRCLVTVVFILSVCCVDSSVFIAAMRVFTD